VEVSQRLTRGLELPVVLGAIADAAAQLFEGEAGFRLVDGNELVRIGATPGARRAMIRERMPIGESISGRVAQTGEPIVTTDNAADPRGIPEDRPILKRNPMRAQMCVPIRLGTRILGALQVYREVGYRFDDQAVRIAMSFADQAAIAIENARLYQESERRRKRLATLVEVSQRLTRGLDLPSVLGSIADAAAQLFEGEAGFRIVEGEELVRVGATPGALPAMVRERLRMGESITGQVAVTGEPIVSYDSGADPRMSADHRAARLEHPQLGSLMCVPIRLGTRALGTLNIYRERGHRFDDDSLRMAMSFADQAAIAIENARLYGHAQAQAKALEAKNAELDSFAYMVSHDLKAPLVTIQGMASMLTQDCGPVLDERSRHYLARIEANIGQMERLIADLLALSRVGRDGRQPQQVCLTEVVDEVLAGMAETIRARGVKVECGEMPTVWGIRTQLAQVFSNLIGNAVKYLGDTDEPRVSVGASDRGVWIECFVRDNGIGVDPAYHGKVFELFQRLKDVPVEGSGVGLPIVKKIVEAAGGRIWVESAKGHGATFFFTWPKTTESR
jgi:signal transduction histidine kinase